MGKLTLYPLFLITVLLYISPKCLSNLDISYHHHYHNQNHHHLLVYYNKNQHELTAYYVAMHFTYLDSCLKFRFSPEADGIRSTRDLLREMSLKRTTLVSLPYSNYCWVHVGRAQIWLVSPKTRRTGCGDGKFQNNLTKEGNLILVY